VTTDSIFADPITLEVVWGRLVTLADEMQTVLRRTAFSTVVSTGNDLGCEIMDTRGWSVAHAVTSNPTFHLILLPPHPGAAAPISSRLSDVWEVSAGSPGWCH
jgi:hypothetical protein